MYIRRSAGPRAVSLPDGSVLSLADLPDAETSRWVASRKLKVVQAVVHGLMSMEEALDRYALSEEEFEIWRDALIRHGEAGLKVTKIQRKDAT